MSTKNNLPVKLLLSMLLLSLAHFAKAQLTLNLRQPSPVQFWIEDTWNFDASNNSGQMEILFVATITDNKQQPIVTLTSTDQLLNTGFSSYTNRDIRTNKIDYHNYPGIALIRQSSMLPFGEYIVCIRAIAKSDQEELTMSCLEYRFSPLSPPVLVSPFDEEEITTSNPLLSWMPPSPIQKEYVLNYHLKLTELLPGQHPTYAIQRNLPWLEVNDLYSSFFQYPTDARPLDTSKTYVWQVAASYQDFPLGLSEVWIFKYGKEKSPVIRSMVTNPTFAIPSRSQDAAFTQAVNLLHMAFTENYISGDLTYEIRDEKNQVVRLDLPLKVKKGDNRFSLDLKASGLFRNRQEYRMLITDLNNDKYYLRFLYLEK